MISSMNRTSQQGIQHSRRGAEHCIKKRDADLKRTCFLVVGLADVCQTCLQAAAALARRHVSARFWTSGEPRGRSRQSAPSEQGEAGVVGSAGKRNRQRSRAGASAGERSGAGAREMLAR